MNLNLEGKFSPKWPRVKKRNAVYSDVTLLFVHLPTLLTVGTT